MFSNTKKSAEATERKLVDAIRHEPGARAPLVELAQYLEISGALEDSKQVYRGILPKAIQERYKLDPYSRSPSSKMATCERLSWYTEENYSLTPPLNDDMMRNSVFHEQHVQTKPEFVDVLHDCTMLYDGKNKLYLDAEGVRNSEHSTMNSYLLTPRSKQQELAEVLPGLSILLAAHNSHNFYHWHFDLMAVLGMVQSAGIRLVEIDNILIDKHNTGFQIQILQSAGIKKDQIKFIDKSCHVKCKEMLMVRLHNRQGLAQSHRHLDWMRTTFLHNNCRNRTQTTPRYIAIKRDSRGFSNAKHVYKQFEKNGYTCIQPETLSYEKQVALFSGASHIVAPHGAGLSLIVYCKPDTIVHEFYADHVQPCFWTIASALGLRYNNYNCSHIVDKATTQNNKNLNERLSKTIDISEEQLSAALS